ncbi:hypothetical protein NECID01_1299 [Nematocida sp. AWRm77]|nr:hypothetical protein NECID01_1299 [Nematocida sp. AWRm77]
MENIYTYFFPLSCRKVLVKVKKGLFGGFLGYAEISGMGIPYEQSVLLWNEPRTSLYGSYRSQHYFLYSTSTGNVEQYANVPIENVVIEEKLWKISFSKTQLQFLNRESFLTWRNTFLWYSVQGSVPSFFFQVQVDPAWTDTLMCYAKIFDYGVWRKSIEPNNLSFLSEVSASSQTDRPRDTRVDCMEHCSRREYMNVQHYLLGQWGAANFFDFVQEVSDKDVFHVVVFDKFYHYTGHMFSSSKRECDNTKNAKCLCLLFENSESEVQGCIPNTPVGYRKEKFSFLETLAQNNGIDVFLLEKYAQAYLSVYSTLEERMEHYYEFLKRDGGLLARMLDTTISESMKPVFLQKVLSLSESVIYKYSIDRFGLRVQAVSGASVSSAWERSPTSRLAYLMTTEKNATYSVEAYPAPAIDLMRIVYNLVFCTLSGRSGPEMDLALCRTGYIQLYLMVTKILTDKGLGACVWEHKAPLDPEKTSAREIASKELIPLGAYNPLCSYETILLYAIQTCMCLGYSSSMAAYSLFHNTQTCGDIHALSVMFGLSKTLISMYTNEKILLIVKSDPSMQKSLTSLMITKNYIYTLNNKKKIAQGFSSARNLLKKRFWFYTSMNSPSFYLNRHLWAKDEASQPPIFSKYLFQTQLQNEALCKLMFKALSVHAKFAAYLCQMMSASPAGPSLSFPLYDMYVRKTNSFCLEKAYLSFYDVESALEEKLDSLQYLKDVSLFEQTYLPSRETQDVLSAKTTLSFYSYLLLHNYAMVHVSSEEHVYRKKEAASFISLLSTELSFFVHLLLRTDSVRVLAYADLCKPLLENVQSYLAEFLVFFRNHALGDCSQSAIFEHTRTNYFLRKGLYCYLMLGVVCNGQDLFAFQQPESLASFFEEYSDVSSSLTYPQGASVYHSVLAHYHPKAFAAFLSATRPEANQ